jgi:hypothetical protein
MKNEKQTLDPSEITLLKEELQRSYQERLDLVISLYKKRLSVDKTSAVHKPSISK